ncbi:MAG: Holliday junction resolvase RecU [Erysipelotrichaceae bacterium]|nr:Holliday junction resolvase RecU [Erysipelotrichaceae bacterium]
MKYPNGKEYKPTSKEKTKAKKPSAKALLSAGNRGMSFESDINAANEYYREKGICLITKRPTPINVVKVDYSKGAIITNAYFEKQSTTDYNGVYKGRYIDFEAKSTKQKVSFPLANIPPQQIEHLTKVIEHQGIAFFLICFELLGETYLLDAQYVIDFHKKYKRKSIPLNFIKEIGDEIEYGLNPRLDYIKAVKAKYFKNK